MLDVCSYGHDPIAYDGRTCPACDLTKERDDLTKEMGELMERIDELEEDLEEAQSS